MTGRTWAALAFAVLMLALLLLTPALMPKHLPHSGVRPSTSTSPSYNPRNTP